MKRDDNNTENIEYIAVPLWYGRANESEFPFTERHREANKLYCVGYNPRFGSVVLCEENGNPYFDARVDVQGALTNAGPIGKEETDRLVEKLIASSYQNHYSGRDSEARLEVITEKR